MGLFRGAVFRHGEGAQKQPIKQPTEMPTSTMALMGRFPSLMGRFPTLMGRFPNFALMGRFPSRKSPGKQPIKKRRIKRFLIKTSTKQKRDRGRDSQLRPRPRLNSQPQGATKIIKDHCVIGTSLLGTEKKRYPSPPPPLRSPHLLREAAPRASSR